MKCSVFETNLYKCGIIVRNEVVYVCGAGAHAVLTFVKIVNYYIRFITLRNASIDLLKAQLIYSLK